MAILFRIHQWFAAAIVVAALALSGTDAASCSCQPSKYRFKFNFENTCQNTTVNDNTDAVLSSSCFVSENSEDSVPVIVNIVEFKEHGASYSEMRMGEYQNEREFDIIVRNKSSPGIDIKTHGLNEAGKVVSLEVSLVFKDFNADCQTTKALKVDDTIGWLEVVAVDLPSVACELPSASPTDAPTESPQPSYLPTDAPTDYPTVLPTDAPTDAATRGNPCDGSVDDPFFLSEGIEGRDCWWIASKPEKRCHLDYRAGEMCPSICLPMCNNSVCDDNRKFLVKDKKGDKKGDKKDAIDEEKVKKDCDWILLKPHTRCLLDEAAVYKCPSVCSPVCNDFDMNGICQNTKNYKHRGKEKRTCDWVAKDTKKRCSLTGNEPFYECPEVCNPFCSTTD